jgi:hypothetical protein
MDGPAIARALEAAGICGEQVNIRRSGTVSLVR